MSDLVVPLTIDPDQLNGCWGSDPDTGARLPDLALDACTSALAAARAQLSNVGELAAALRADRTRTPDAVALEVRRRALAAGERSAAALDRARAQVATAVAELNALTAAPPPPQSPIAAGIEAEVRAGLARLRPDRRREVIAQAFADGDQAVIGAVLHAPAIASGLDKDELAMVRDRYRAAYHPANAARLERLERALGVMDRAGSSLVAFTEKATQAGLPAEERAEAAQRALAAAEAKESA